MKPFVTDLGSTGCINQYKQQRKEVGTQYTRILHTSKYLGFCDTLYRLMKKLLEEFVKMQLLSLDN